jgi:hypothetical protein
MSEREGIELLQRALAKASLNLPSPL